MKYKTLTFDTNKPTVQQIAAPLNSKYGIAVKVQRDNKDVACNMADIEVDGLSATSQRAGYNLYELSSDGTAGISVKSIDVDAPDTFDIDVPMTASGRGESIFGPSDVTVASNVKLSSYFTEPITVRYDSFSAHFNMTQTSIADGTVVTTEDDTTNLTLTFSNYDKAYITPGFSQIRYQPYGKGITLVDELTITPDITVLRYFVAKAGNNMTAEGAINICSNDSLKTRFTLQVNQRDLGYIEC